MVAKISVGSSLYGALSYNGEKLNKDEAHLLGANKIVLPPDEKVNIGQLVDNFHIFMPKQGRTKKPVLHISLNPHPDDRLTDQEFEMLAREYLEKIGFGDQPWIAFKHEDIDRHHIHIVTVNVDEQGKRIDMAFLHRRSKKATQELEEKYNLKKADRQKVDPNESIRKIDPAGDLKRQVANAVKLVGMRYKFQTLGEFNAVLGLYNIRCEQTDGRVNGREYHGLVYFAMDDNGNTIATPFKASRLGKFASRAAIDGHFQRSETGIDIRPTKRIVKDAMDHAAGKQDFIDKLKVQGIDLVLRYTEEGRIYGATYVDHNTQTVLNGSRLGREFSANTLEQWFNNPQQAQAPTPSSSQSQPQQPQPAAPSVAPSTTPYDSDDFTIPGLDLFQNGQTVNPDEEEFIRRMKRKKKRGPRPKF